MFVIYLTVVSPLPPCVRLVVLVQQEWFAPAIARQICRHLKKLTDSSPHAWSNFSSRITQPATADSGSSVEGKGARLGIEPVASLVRAACSTAELPGRSGWRTHQLQYKGAKSVPKEILIFERQGRDISHLPNPNFQGNSGYIVSLFIAMRHYLSHHIMLSRETLARSKGK